MTLAYFYFDNILYLENPMDKRAWWATVHGGRKRVKQDIATKQQQKKDKLEQAVTNESNCKGL